MPAGRFSMSITRSTCVALSLAIAGGAAATWGPPRAVVAELQAQTQAAPRPGTVEHIKVHENSREGNFGGNSADPAVAFSPPPISPPEGGRRYPVIYLLHG